MYKINPRWRVFCGEKLNFSERTVYFDNFRRTVRVSLPSGSLPNVKMMKAADLRNFHHPEVQHLASSM